MLNALLPKGAPFFELLLQQNKILCTVAELLVDTLETPADADKPRGEISVLEAEADEIYLAVTRHLSQTFITPIDREDLLHINKKQEELIDLFHNLSNRLFILEFRQIRFPMLQLARVARDMMRLTRSMLEGLSKKRDSHNTREFLALRNECEMLLSTGLAELYDVGESSPQAVLEVIKWSRAYDRMEKLVNYVVQLVEVIEEEVLKNA